MWNIGRMMSTGWNYGCYATSVLLGPTQPVILRLILGFLVMGIGYVLLMLGAWCYVHIPAFLETGKLPEAKTLPFYTTVTKYHHFLATQNDEVNQWLDHFEKTKNNNTATEAAAKMEGYWVSWQTPKGKPRVLHNGLHFTSEYLFDINKVGTPRQYQMAYEMKANKVRLTGSEERNGRLTTLNLGLDSIWKKDSYHRLQQEVTFKNPNHFTIAFVGSDGKVSPYSSPYERVTKEQFEKFFPKEQYKEFFPRR